GSSAPPEPVRDARSRQRPLFTLSSISPPSLPSPAARSNQSAAAVLRVEAVGVGPADRPHESVDIVAGLGAVIHLIGVLVHIEHEDRLAAGKRRRMVGRPGVDETLVARI